MTKGAADGVPDKGEWRRTDSLRWMFDNFPDAVLLSSADGNTVAANPAAIEMFGMSEDELCRAGRSGIVDPEDHRLAGILTRRRRKGKVRAELRFRRKDGSSFPAEVTSVFVDGGPNAFIIIRDLSRQKKVEQARRTAEDALRGSEERYRRLFEIESDAVVLIDRDTQRIFDINTAALRLYGYSREEFLRLEGRDLSAEPEETARNIAAGVTKVPLRWHRKKNGNVFSVEIAASFFEDQGRRVNVEAIRDITGRMRNEEALREAEQTYRALIETTQTGYVVLDPHGAVLDANKEYLRLSGHETLVEIVGRSVVDWTAEYDRRRNSLEVEKCLQQGFVRGLEIDYINKDGQVTPVEIDATAVRVGGRLQIVTLCRDITARKQGEQRLLEYQQQLQALTAELTAVENRERRRLAAILHDDVAQCLALSMIKLEMLRSSAPEQAQPLVDASLSLTHQAIQKIRSLMQEFSNPVLQELGLVAALELLIEEMAAQHGLRCRFRCLGALPALDEDLKTFLYAATRELLINIVKHAEANGGDVRITAKEAEISVCVEDNGKGFDPARAFDAYPQGGFGLLNLREHVRHLGGKCEIRSVRGGGSRVTFTVPVPPAA